MSDTRAQGWCGSGNALAEALDLDAAAGSVFLLPRAASTSSRQLSEHPWIPHHLKEKETHFMTLEIWDRCYLYYHDYPQSRNLKTQIYYLFFFHACTCICCMGKTNIKNTCPFEIFWDLLSYCSSAWVKISPCFRTGTCFRNSRFMDTKTHKKIPGEINPEVQLTTRPLWIQCSAKPKGSICLLVK